MNIHIIKECWDKIIAYAQSSYDQFGAEIGGMAIAYRLNKNDKDFIVDKPVILKQTVSSGNCVLDKDALAEYYTLTAMENQEKLDLSFVWWHSHHTMKAYWSGTDLNTIEEMNGSDYSFALVVNLKEEFKFRVSAWNPIEIHQDVSISILKPESEEDESLNNEVKSLCSKPSYNYGGTYVTYKNGRRVGNNSSLPFNFNSNWDEKPPRAIIQAVQGLVDDVCSGVVNEKEFKKEMNLLRKQIEGHSIWTVAKLTVPQIKECQLLIEAEDLIYKEKETWDYNEMITEKYTEDAMEVRDWNKGFMV